MEFLSVRAAAERVGKSTSSIRRLIHPIVKKDDHPDRDLVQPGVAEAMQLRVAGEVFPWKVSEELLKRVQVAETRTDHSPTPGAARATGDGDLLAMLRRELDIKNRQITQQSELLGRQMELISGLGERLREGNILMGSLQQRFALTEARDGNPAAFVNAKTSTMPAPKKRIFDRLFRRAA